MSEHKALIAEIDGALRFADTFHSQLLTRCRTALQSSAPANHEAPTPATRFNLLRGDMFPSDTGLWIAYQEHHRIVAALRAQLSIVETD